ncbi:hypothetical protein BC629DRAFT_656702 [Irpex lacteus]|nr:hypothetical protein BC629DRAFT_656702 [Irpex lacteus]
MTYTMGLFGPRAQVDFAGQTTHVHFQAAVCADGLFFKASSKAIALKPEDHPLPAHFKSEFPSAWPCLRPILVYMFTSLTIVSFGHTNLEETWRMTRSDEERYVQYMDRIAARVSTIAVAASLFLSCIVTLLTTTPVSELFHYTRRGPYLCLGIGAAILWGGIIIASSIVFVSGMCSAKWAEETLMRTRIRLVLMMTILAYPFMAIGCATSVCICGVVVAVWTSGDPVAQAACVSLVFTPASFVFFFIATQINRPSPSQLTCGMDSHV